MTNVLLSVYTAGHFVELRRLARLLTQVGGYRPTIWFAWPYEGSGRDLAACRAEGIACLEDRTGSRVVVPGEAVSVPSRGVRRRVVSWIRAAVSRLPFPVPVIRALYRQGQYVRLARRVVARVQPACVVLAADDYETAVVTRAAHRFGVRVMVVPFTVANAVEAAEALYHDRRYGLDRWDNRLVGLLFPKWVYEHRGRRMLRLLAPQVLAKECWGLAPPQPWQMNSGRADVIAVESPSMRDHYVREGLPERRLVLTGSLADDALASASAEAAERRASLYKELGLPADRPLLLCALPPDQFSLSAAQTDFADYAELVRFWIQSLAAVPGFNVIVRPHPRVQIDALRHVEQWGVRLTDHDTASLIPLCDIFVASVSATIRWALACGRPVLNYDVYRLRYGDYVDVPGVLHAEERHEFVAALARLTAGPRLQARGPDAEQARRWGLLDGKSRLRILGCLERLIADARGQAA